MESCDGYPLSSHTTYGMTSTNGGIIVLRTECPGQTYRILSPSYCLPMHGERLIYLPAILTLLLNISRRAVLKVVRGLSHCASCSHR